MKRMCSYRGVCVQCKQEFWAARCDAKYCSPNCRKRSARRKDGVDRTARNALADISSLKRQMEMYPDLAEYVHRWLDAIVLSATIAGVPDDERVGQP